MWVFWKEWNNRIFKGLEQSIVGVKLSFSQTLYARMTTLSGHSFSRLLDFLDCCTFLGSFFLINNLIWIQTSKKGWGTCVVNKAHGHTRIEEWSMMNVVESIVGHRGNWFLIWQIAMLQHWSQSRNWLIHWELNFNRAIQDWELESAFLDLLYSTKVEGAGVDELCCWKPLN